MKQITYTGLLEKLLFVILLALPYTLFVVHAGFIFPFITVKTYLFCILVEIAFGLWLILRITKPNHTSLKHPYLLVWLLFVCVSLLANINGTDFARSFWSTPERMQGFNLLLHFFILSIVLVSFFRSEKYWHIYLHNLLLALCGLIGIALYKQFGIVSWSSTLGNAIYFAGVCVIGFFLSLFFLCSLKKQTRQKYLLYILYLLSSLQCLLGVLYSDSRGAFIGCLFGAAIYILSALLNWSRSPFRKVISTSIIISFCFLISLAWTHKEQIGNSWLGKNIHTINRLSQVSLQDKTTKHRLANWSIAFQGIQEKPLLGWGQENYNTVFAKYYSPEKLFDAEDYFDRAHNAYLDILVFSGSTGLLAYLIIFGFIAYTIIKHSIFSYWQKTALLALLTSYLVQNIFAFDSLATSLYIFSLLAFITIGTTRTNSTPKKTYNPHTYIVALALCLPFITYQLNIKPMIANKEYTLGLKYFTYKQYAGKCQQLLNSKFDYGKADFLAYCHQIKQYDFDTNKSLFPAFNQMESALTSHANVSYPLAEYLLNLVKVQHLFSAQEQVRYHQLISASQKQLEHTYQYDEKLNSLYGYYLFIIGEKAQADKYLLKSLSLAPRKYTTLNKIAETRTLNGQIEKAKRILNLARQFGPHKETEQLYKNIQHLKGIDSF